MAHAEDGAICTICLEPFEVGGAPVCELACSQKHVFHADCLKAWLVKESTCPICRETITGEIA